MVLKVRKPYLKRGIILICVKQYGGRILSNVAMPVTSASGSLVNGRKFETTGYTGEYNTYDFSTFSSKHERRYRRNKESEQEPMICGSTNHEFNETTKRRRYVGAVISAGPPCERFFFHTAGGILPLHNARTSRLKSIFVLSPPDT